MLVVVVSCLVVGVLVIGALVWEIGRHRGTRAKVDRMEKVLDALTYRRGVDEEYDDELAQARTFMSADGQRSRPRLLSSVAGLAGLILAFPRRVRRSPAAAAGMAAVGTGIATLAVVGLPVTIGDTERAPKSPRPAAPPSILEPVHKPDPKPDRNATEKRQLIRLASAEPEHARVKEEPAPTDRTSAERQGAEATEDDQTNAAPAPTKPAPDDAPEPSDPSPPPSSSPSDDPAPEPEESSNCLGADAVVLEIEACTPTEEEEKRLAVKLNPLE